MCIGKQGDYMNYIIDYEIVKKRLKEMPNIQKQKSIKTNLGYEIPYYTYGKGENHIVIVGGTHGSEIISVDFVLKVMDMVSNKKEPFKSFDENTYTLHFIPLQNPEGFIASTSAIRTLISENMSLEQMEKVCKKYYELYKQDDTNTKNNPNDRSLKLHQQMFIDANVNCIPDKHQYLKHTLNNIFSNEKIPKGSMISYRANGSGIELNRNVPINSGIEDIKNNQEKYGSLRYNNIPTTVPGPIGIPCKDVNNFEYEPENKFLNNLLDKLYKENKLKYCLLYHGTGGAIYYKPLFDAYKNDLTKEKQKYIETINKKLAIKYSEITNYNLIEDEDKNVKSYDSYLRTIYPGILLIELSKMGGNPIGPYGDIKNNYLPTIDINLKALKELFENNK